MTGCFVLKKNGKEIKAVELPEEISKDIYDWWYKAENGDKLEIYCELGV